MAHDQRHERHRATVMRALLPLSLSLSLSRRVHWGFHLLVWLPCGVLFFFSISFLPLREILQSGKG